MNLEVLYVNQPPSPNVVSAPVIDDIRGLSSTTTTTIVIRLLHQNQLSGPIPSSIGSLVNLEVLYVNQPPSPNVVSAPVIDDIRGIVFHDDDDRLQIP